MKFDEIYEKLENVRYYAKNNFVPIIRDNSAKYLYEFVVQNKCKKVLEIGTAIGYSGSILISAGVEQLVTIDINKDYLSMAKQLFDGLQISNKIRIICKDAKDVIIQLKESQEKFDLIFLDGAKGQYVRYLPVLTSLLNDNGFIFADNVFLGGMVESEEIIPHKKRSMVVNLRKYLAEVNKKPYVTEIIRLEDGIAITKVERS